MILQSTARCIVRVNDEKEIEFPADDPIPIPARWAVPLLIERQEQIELISSVSPGAGCRVTWLDADGQSQVGLVLLHFVYRDERWVFVQAQADSRGRFLRCADLIGVNPRPLLSFAREAMETVGTPEAKEMTADVIMHLCGLKPDD